MAESTAGLPPLGGQHEYDYRLGKGDAQNGRPRDPQGSDSYNRGYNSVRG